MTCILTLIKNFGFLAKFIFLLSIEISKLIFFYKTHTFNLSKFSNINCLLAKRYVDILCIIQFINNLNILLLQNLALNTHSRVEKKLLLKYTQPWYWKHEKKNKRKITTDNMYTCMKNHQHLHPFQMPYKRIHGITQTTINNIEATS